MVETKQIGRSVFVGYSDREIRKSNDFVVSAGLPGIEEHQNLVAFPDVDALYHLDGSIVPGSRLVHFDDSMVDPDRMASAARKYERYFPLHRIIPDRLKAVVEEPVVLLGHTVPHWGHFLVDGLSRMWALISGDVNPKTDRILFTNRRRWAGFEATGFAMPLLSALGVDLTKVIRPTAPTLFRHVKIALPSVNYTFRIFPKGAEVHRRIATQIGSSRRFDRPVFISRAGVKKGIHDFVGEDVLEQELVAKGFEAVRPETLSVSEQIALFANAPLIVGSIGSAFHSILFEPECGDRMRVMFSPPSPGKRFPMVDAVCEGHTSWYINVATQARERGEKTVIDVGRAFAYLEETPLRDII